MSERSSLKAMDFSAPRPAETPSPPATEVNSTAEKESSTALSQLIGLNDANVEPMRMPEFRLNKLNERVASAVAAVEPTPMVSAEDANTMQQSLNSLLSEALNVTGTPAPIQEVTVSKLEGVEVPEPAATDLALDMPPEPSKPREELPAMEVATPVRDHGELPVMQVEAVPAAPREELPMLSADTATEAATAEPLPSMDLEASEQSAPSEETFVISEDVTPFETTDEEILTRVGVEDPATVDEAESALAATIAAAQREIEERKKMGDLYDVQLGEGYNPFRVRLEKQALDVLSSALALQRQCDIAAHKSVITQATNTVDTAWGASIGRVVKGFHPTKWIGDTTKSRAIAKYQKCGTLTEIAVMLESELRGKVSTSQNDAAPITCNNGTVAGAVTLITALSRKHGIIGVKVDQDFDKWEQRKDIAAVVSMEDFGGVYVLFDVVTAAQKYRRYMYGRFKTELIDLDEKRHLLRLEREESIAGTGLQGVGTATAVESEPEQEPVPEAPTVEEPTPEPTTSEAEATPEEATQSTEQASSAEQETTSERGPYRPFKSGLIETAIKALQDAKVYQQYEDYKATPHGISGLINAFRPNQQMQQGGVYSGSYGSTYGGGYNSGMYGSTTQQRSGLFNRTPRDPNRPRIRDVLGAGINQGIENMFADCNDLDKLLKMQAVAMHKVSPRLMRKIRAGRMFSPVHKDGLGAIMACKILQLTLSKKSGVQEVLVGDIGGGGGFDVALYDFNELRCVFNNQEDAEAFVEYMNEFVSCGPYDRGMSRTGYGAGYGRNSYGSTYGATYGGYPY